MGSRMLIADSRMKKLVLTALFAALAIGLSTLEGLVPITAFLPIPGLRLGIANLAVMGAYYLIGRKNAVCVCAIRILCVFLTFGNVTSCLLSASGAALSLLSLFISEKGCGKLYSFVGVSALSAFCHAAGQITAAVLLTSSVRTFSVFPPLAFFSVLTGALCGMLMDLVYAAIRPVVGNAA